jgi:8-oxo-dGTP pyrophosphatase MutT (NUDIX family)
MRICTLLFLVKKNENGEISDILLAMKKRGFGTGKWNGVGGKVGENESIQLAAIREAKEEIGIDIDAMDLNSVGELEFKFIDKPDWNQIVHIYLVSNWDGEIIETEEMRPEWFKIQNIPYEKMWVDDIHWLPKVLNGKVIGGFFEFDKDQNISGYDLYEK